MAQRQYRGFASFPPEQRRAVASKGGKAAHAKGTAHRWTVAEAKAAGRKGGLATRRQTSLHTQLQATYRAWQKRFKLKGSE